MPRAPAQRRDAKARRKKLVLENFIVLCVLCAFALSLSVVVVQEIRRLNGSTIPRAAGSVTTGTTRRLFFHFSGSGVTPATRFFATTTHTAAINGHQRSPILSKNYTRSGPDSR